MIYQKGRKPMKDLVKKTAGCFITLAMVSGIFASGSPITAAAKENDAQNEIPSRMQPDTIIRYINNFYPCWDYKDTKVNFRKTMFWQQEDLSEDEAKEENILDQLEEIRLSLPDEKGFVESTLIPELMLPGSIIYFTDDTHYIIVEGGISLDTQEKVDTYYNNRKQGVEDAIEKGYIVAPMERPSAGSCVTYGDDGAMYHIYSREKILSNELEWYYENNGCEAVVTGFHTKSPVVYYRLDGNEWMEYPLSKWDRFSDEELTQIEIRKIEKTEDKIVITAACGKEEVTEEILFD